MADETLYVTTDGARWGAGTGEPLDAEQIDTNFWGLNERVREMEENPPVAVSVADVVVVGDTWSVQLTDDTVLGPFAIPVAQVELVNWLNNQELQLGWLAKVEDQGVYQVLQTHTTPAAPGEFDPNLMIGGNPVYRLWFETGPARRHVIALQILGPIPDYEGLVCQFIVPLGLNLRLPADLARSRAFMRVPPSVNISLPILKNDEEVGWIHWSAEDQAGEFELEEDVDLSADDLLIVLGPDATGDGMDMSVSIVADILEAGDL